MTANNPPIIRLLAPTDSLEDLTFLIHSAYRQLAKLGFQYVGTNQTVDVTRKRVSLGECYVALMGERIVGTVVLNDSNKTASNAWYDKSDVTSFSQFAVDPDFQKQGIGRSLLDLIEQRAMEQGLKELACDTAEDASHLIALYSQRGYREVGKADWSMTNYESVILSKTLMTTADI